MNEFDELEEIADDLDGIASVLLLIETGSDHNADILGLLARQNSRSAERIRQCVKGLQMQFRK